MKPEELLHHFSPYLPTDRFRALLRNSDLPASSEGAALMVDISGFTPMTTQLVVDYGPERASEELNNVIIHIARLNCQTKHLQPFRQVRSLIAYSAPFTF